MSEIAQVQTDETVSQSAADQEEAIVPTKTAEELVKRLKEVSQENQLMRKKNAEYKKQLEEEKKKTLQDNGQFKELAEVRAREAQSYKEQSEKLRQAFAFKTVGDAVMLEAHKLGCVDAESLINLIPLDQIPVDENFNVDKDSARALLEDFRKTKPYFFQKAAPKIVDATPAKVEPQQMNLGKMTLAERAALLSQLKNQGK